MAGRPSKRNLVIKEIEEVKESPIEKEAVDISKVEEEVPKKETTFEEYKEEALKDPEFKEIYDKTPIRRGIVKCDTPTSWLNVRNAPNGDIIGRLDHGSAVDIFEIEKDFAKISATENKWVSLAYIV